ncbi:MAG: CopG family antitoxin [Pseudomonadota bacterium]
MTDPEKREFLNDEERQLVEQAEAVFDDPNYEAPSAAKRETLNARWKMFAEASSKRKPVTMRLPNRDIERLKAVAERKGMPYQTLVASVLHQYLNGDLVER